MVPSERVAAVLSNSSSGRTHHQASKTFVTLQNKTADMDDISPRVAAYLAHRIPAASDIEISGVSRIPGGASRETYRFVANWKESGRLVRRPLILRRDPVSSLIETERDVEFNAYRAFHPTGLPVPEPLYIET